MTPVEIRDRVWWNDVDAMGVMYFARYLRFAEIAETEFFRAHGFTYDAIHREHGVWLARVHCEMDFRAPAMLDDELICRAELAKIGGSSLGFRFAVERAHDRKRLADVQLTLASVNGTTYAATRLPLALRDALRQTLIASES